MPASHPDQAEEPGRSASGEDVVERRDASIRQDRSQA